MTSDSPLQYRTYGSSGPPVVVVHGGPGAPGSAAPVACGFAHSFRVCEPFQRGSGCGPLTVARHVEDLHGVMTHHGRGVWPALVGESWGAMLALAYAAEHAGTCGPVVLVGCGTFDAASRRRYQEIIDERMDDGLRDRIAEIELNEQDDAIRLARLYGLLAPLYDYDPLPDDEPFDFSCFDATAHTDTWNDMLRLQEAGVYPAAFEAVRSPVLMVHGSYDPHPGAMIRDSLIPVLGSFDYVELDRCGHSPWKERHAREEFFRLVSSWLVETAGHAG